jgi:thiol-disulfide isomerase/thioredoxin
MGLDAGSHRRATAGSEKSWRAACVLAALLFAGMLLGCSREASEPSGLLEKTTGDSVTVEVNSKAPALAAKLAGGGEVRLADLIGNHVILVEFWSIFCKSCLEEMPKIHALHAKYGPQGLAVLSVNTDVFSDERIMGTLKKAGISLQYPILRDTRQEISRAFQVELLPVTVIIDRSGWIRLYQEGYRPGDEERFEKTIRDLLRTEGQEDVTLAPRGGVTTFAPAGRQLAAKGAKREPLKLRSLDGKSVDVGEGKPTLLFFWSLYCQPCREEFPAVEELRKKYAASGVTVSTVNVDSHFLADRVMRFIAPYPDLPCLPDWAEGKPGALAERYGVSATPTAVLLDGEGKVVAASEGMTGFSEVERQLAALLEKP